MTRSPRTRIWKRWMRATAMAREVKADCIVSVGGGSVIDTGKGVCVTLKKGGKANDHLNFLILTEPQTPHIVIPTTSGTGSEVTNVAVLTSHGAGRKLFIVGYIHCAERGDP